MPRAAVVLVLIALAGIVLVFALRPAPSPVAPSPSATASVTSRTPAATSTAPSADVPAACRGLVRGTTFATGSIDERARAAELWMASHRGQQASVVVTEDIVNAAAVRETRDQPVRDLRIAIEPAGFRLSATAVVIGSFPIRALLVPTASGGALRVDLRELDTDGLPGFFRGTVQDSITRAADPTAWGITMRIDGVAMANGCAVIWGTA
jgi:hypothetical protein